MDIICATDFSEAASAAADLAAALAGLFRDRVVLAHVVEPARVIGLETPSHWESQLESAAQSQLEAIATRLRARGVPVECRLLLGDPVPAISEQAAAPGVRMIVLGSHGRKGLAHLLVGSVAEGVVRAASLPVLVTRGLPYPWVGLTGQRRLHLLVALEGGPAADAALGWVRAVRQQVPCDVTCVQVYAAHVALEHYGLVGEGGSAPDSPLLHRLLERELRRWVGALPGEGDVQFRLCAASGNPIESLAREAEVLQPDLVVTGITPGRFAGAPPEQTAGEVLRAFKLPVVCVPESLRAPASRAIPAVRRVLVGTDLSDFANRAIGHACALLARRGGTLEICYVDERLLDIAPFPGVPPAPRPLDAAARSELEARLATLAPPDAAAAGIATKVAIVQAATAADGLRQEAARMAADVVVVASHGRRGLAGALLGSVAAELGRRCPAPLLVVHLPRV